MLTHGGQLKSIAKRHQIPLEQWLDLSTGISPYPYPVGDIPECVWQRLPEWDDELIDLAEQYYHLQDLLPIAGSQAVIQLLPSYRKSLVGISHQVWLPKQGYKEHEKAWGDAGFQLRHYQDLPPVEQVETEDIVVVINPNNPTGYLANTENLQRIANKLERGWLILDEAFKDALIIESPDVSASSSLSACSVPTSGCDIFVLRSLGKFFGLAGSRVGFVHGRTEHLQALAERLGPWHVSGPSAYVAKQALADKVWQGQQKLRIERDSRALRHVLMDKIGAHVKRITGTDLFCTVYLDDASIIFTKLCEQGVYVRLTDEQDALRFGLPTQRQLPKLIAALSAIFPLR